MLHIPLELQQYIFRLGCQDFPTITSDVRQALQNKRCMHPFAMVCRSTCRLWRESTTSHWIYFIHLKLHLDLTGHYRPIDLEDEMMLYHQALVSSKSNRCNLFIQWDLHSNEYNTAQDSHPRLIPNVLSLIAETLSFEICSIEQVQSIYFNVTSTIALFHFLSMRLHVPYIRWVLPIELEPLRNLLEYPPHKVDDIAYRNALHIAVTSGSNISVKALLMLSKDHSWYDESLLFVAAKSGHKSVMKVLLKENRMAPNPRDQFGRTPLSWAAGNGHESVVGVLLERDGIVRWGEGGERERVDPNSRDGDGRTPLSWAAEGGQVSVVKMLLKQKSVCHDCKDDENRTPLWWAAESGHVLIVKILLEQERVGHYSGGRRYRPLSWVDEYNNGDRTTLLWAAQNGHTLIVKLLLDQDRIDPDSKDDNDRTPLSLAAESGHELIVKMLLDRFDVDPDSKDDDGRTPLSRAMETERVSIVKMLLERDDVDPNSKDNSGRTPLSWAKFSRQAALKNGTLEREMVVHESVIDVLLKHIRHSRAVYNDRFGQTASEAAEEWDESLSDYSDPDDMSEDEV